MLKLYYGEEKYLLRQKKAEVIASVVEPEFNLLVSAGFDRACEDFLNTFSMFGTKTLVLDIDELTTAYEAVLRYEDLADIHIFSRKVDSRTKVFKALSEGAVVFNKRRGTELSQFCIKELALQGAQITKDAYELLIERSGYLVNEAVCLDTIIIYLRQCALDSSAITRDIVLKFVPECADVKIWGLFEYLTKKNLTGFFKYFDKLVEQKEVPIGILSMMLRNARIGYKASFCGRNAAKDIGVQSAALFATKGLSAKQLSELMGLLQSSVNSIKNGAEPVLTVRAMAVKAIDIF